jgi:hypothetical protein
MWRICETFPKSATEVESTEPYQSGKFPVSYSLIKMSLDVRFHSPNLPWRQASANELGTFRGLTLNLGAESLPIHF